ncbi:helix-turn-helix domain-containing protein [Rossellomorea sp. AcN35-11]|nr:helix-turn-helix domain-containing protein [Rossellomorea sp. AcN35-11]
MNYSEVRIDSKHLPQLENVSKRSVQAVSSESPDTINDLATQVEQYEKKIILKVLEQNNGNKTAAAKTLNISVRNLYYKIEKYNIEINSMK